MEERTSGNSERRLEMHWGVERRVAWRGGGWSRQGKANLRGTRRGQAKHSLAGYIQEKKVVAEKICSKDG